MAAGEGEEVMSDLTPEQTTELREELAQADADLAQAIQNLPPEWRAWLKEQWS